VLNNKALASVKIKPKFPVTLSKDLPALAEINSMKVKILYIIPCLLAGCSGSASQLLRNDAVTKNYAYQGNIVNVNYAMPREGWATDPHLSYDLYSYYPVNHYNNGIIGHYGYHGAYYY